jgi:2-polyprenyl-6-methoxyphenol hydroxylase-like FAD-dependent oxidoreductase
MTKALIIGAGIAGPVVAMALQRAGIESLVYEAYPRASNDVGSYLTVATNGLAALRAIDAHAPVKSAGFPTRHIVLWSSTGKRLGTVPLGSALADGTASITIKRSRLCRVLHEQAALRHIPIAYGKRFTDIERPHNGCVIARFEDGTRGRGDLLIGCDGVHSVIRQTIDPEAPAGRYVGLVNFGGYTAKSVVPVETGVWHMVFAAQAFFGYVGDASGGIVWFANVPRDELSRSERLATTAAQWKQRLIDLFTRERSPATAIIAAGALELTADNTHDLPTTSVC